MGQREPSFSRENGGKPRSQVFGDNVSPAREKGHSVIALLDDQSPTQYTLPVGCTRFSTQDAQRGGRQQQGEKLADVKSFGFQILLSRKGKRTEKVTHLYPDTTS